MNFPRNGNIPSFYLPEFPTEEVCEIVDQSAIVAKVVFPTGPKQYDFFTDLKLRVNEIVVCDTVNGFVVGRVTGFKTGSIFAHRWIVQRVDVEAFEDRQKIRQNKGDSKMKTDCNRNIDGGKFHVYMHPDGSGTYQLKMDDERIPVELKKYTKFNNPAELMLAMQNKVFELKKLESDFYCSQCKTGHKIEDLKLKRSYGNLVALACPNCGSLDSLFTNRRIY